MSVLLALLKGCNPTGIELSPHLILPWGLQKCLLPQYPQEPHFHSQCERPPTLLTDSNAAVVPNSTHQTQAAVLSPRLSMIAPLNLPLNRDNAGDGDFIK